MNLSGWLRIFLHPIVLWIAGQITAFYFFLSFTPEPKGAVKRFFISVQKGIHEVAFWISSPWRALKRVDELEQLTAQLQSQLSSLSDTTAYIPFPAGAIGDFSAVAKYKFLPAKVVYQSLLLRENYAILNRGGRDGIYPGLGVIDPQGVIGLVAETTATYSIMYALFHKNVHLAATLPRHGVIGVVGWKTPTLNSLFLEYIPLYVRVEPDEEVWTAPNSLIFPAGLRIGRVRAVRSDFTRGFHAIQVDTYADWSRLSGVFILIPPS
ncbi:MAG: rod shape-determining protein MreC [Bacteroidia bacterium]|nr:rod shape-determining protein MreC [Bacteroidia bacterium]MCX7652673.1 rod shape-determining protein MreC [Bacteroidia bacterium]MDW8416973.1 rod shape-determining protein MreC [Bacteroidia bacterium]